HYRLRILPSIRDVVDNPLDGNGDGTGGDPYTHTFDLRLPGGFVFETASNDSFAAATSLPLIEDPSGSGYLVGHGFGSLDPAGDNDYWKFDVLAGDRISISVDVPNGGINPYLVLYNPGETYITEDGDSGPNQAAFLSRYTIPASGTYYARIYPNSGIAEYQLRVDLARTVQLEADAEYANDSVAGANALTLTTAGNQRSGTIAGTIMDGQSGNVDEDYFNLGAVSAGETILLSIRLPQSSSLRPVIEIRNAANQVVNVTANPSDAVARADISTAGSYYATVVARGGQGHFGQYLLDAAVQLTSDLNFSDLVVSSITAPTIAASGQTVNFQWAVGNFGAVATPVSSWSDRVVLSYNDRFGDEDDFQVALVPHSGALSVGSNYTAQASVDLPVGLSGRFFVFVKTDAANSVPEFIFESNNVRPGDTNLDITLTPYADLTAKNVTAPSIGVVGAPANISWVVTNAGNGITGNGRPAGTVSAWSDRVVLSHNGIYGDADDVILANVPRASAMNAGVQYAGNFNGALPAGLSGTYTVFIFADAADQVYEYTNAAPNLALASGTMSIASGPYADLTVENFSGTADAAVGQTIAVSWTTRNGNSASATTPVSAWHDRVVLSSDLILGNGDDRVVANIAHNGTLAVGASYSVNTNVTLPSDVSGNWNLFLVTDPFNAVYEFQYEGNNTSTNQPIIIRLPDLAVTTVTAPLVGNPGGPASVSWTVTNSGVATAYADWSDRVYFSTQSTLDGSAISLGNFSAAVASPLNSGTNYALTHTVTLPNLAPGNYFIIVAADTSNAQLESNEANNTRSTAIDLRAPDLQIVNLGVIPVSLMSGLQLTVRWDVTNSGSNATTGSWYDRLTISNTTTHFMLLDTPVYYDANSGGAIPVGQSRLRQQIFRLPDGTNGAGNLVFTVVADTFNQVAEYNASNTGESNNAAVLSRAAALAAYPDLAVNRFQVTPPTFESGGQLTATWVITNLGTAPITGDFYDRVQVRNLTLGTAIRDQSFYLNPSAEPEGPIAPGQSREHTATFELPDGLAGVGNIEVALSLDWGNRIFEFRDGVDAEANNGSNIVRTSTLALYPDLVVSNVTAPPTGLPGQPITVGWTVRNSGTAVAPASWSDQVFLVDDASPGSAQLIGTFSFTNTIAVGVSSNVTQSVTLPFFAVGTRRLAVRANSGSAFYEPDFANNYRTSITTIALSPRLEFTLNRTSVPESGSSNSVVATVLRNSSTAGDLTVTLSATDTNSVNVPATIVIPAGQTYRTFAVVLLDNQLVDSNRIVALTAAAAGFASDAVDLLVQDDDLARLTLQLTPPVINEDAGVGAAMGFLTRNTATNTPLTVTVVSDSPTHLLPPATVVIPAGQRSVAFAIDAPTNTTIDGASDVRLQVSAPGFLTGSADMLVIDNDAPTLGLTLAANAIVEGAESPATTGRLTRNPPFTSPLAVVLQQTIRGLLLLPPELTIPAGQGEVNFNISVTDDQLVNGTRTNEVIALVRGANGPPITNGQAIVLLAIYDNDGPSLTLALASDVVTENGSVTGTVTRNTGTSGNLIVTLISSAPGEALPATTTVPINNGQTSASFTINGVPDGTNDGIKAVIISASASGYNSATAQLNVSDIDLPDLAVGDIIVPSSGQIDAKANVTFTVANSGPVPANGPWVDRIYISTDNQLGGDTLAGAVTNSVPLAPNSSYTRTVSIDLPSDPARYHIIVVTDADNQLFEGSERNNVISV
ncbi:MAG TPA: CARDB domain-containing protein, partial [Candidatus Acidoferrum sp.]|nr:CARDB domain-containing protein [Candidatus Acidoferrum sp.]